MHAKFEIFTKEIAARLFPATVAQRLSPEAFVLFVVGHEIAHGAGPDMVTAGSQQVSIKHSLRDLYSMLEEAKADVLGLTYLQFLAQKSLLSQQLADEAALTHITDIFRTLRFGLHEDHARGVLLQYNWLKAHGAVVQDQQGKFTVNEKSVAKTVEGLADAIMQVQRQGSYEQAQAFVKKWSTVPPEIDNAIAQLSDLPIDFEPIFTVNKFE